MRYPKLARRPSDRHPQHSLTHYHHLHHHLFPFVLYPYLRSSLICSCRLLRRRRISHISHVPRVKPHSLRQKYTILQKKARTMHLLRHLYDATAVFKIRSTSVNLVSIGAVNALKWCKAGDSVDLATKTRARCM